MVPERTVLCHNLDELFPPPPAPSTVKKKKNVSLNFLPVVRTDEQPINSPLPAPLFVG